jgi:hypothetical protein
MSPRIIHILEAFAKLYHETGKEQPIMVIARYVTNTKSSPHGTDRGEKKTSD